MKSILKYFLVLLLLTAGVFLAFGDALTFGFLGLDTVQYVIHNTCITSINSENLKCMFSSLYMMNWHPLTWLSHAIDIQLFDYHAYGHHLTNLLLHTLNSFLIFIIAKLIFDSLYKQPLNRHFTFIAALSAAFLFAIHPQHTESVVWVTERKGLLCTFFLLISFIMHRYYVLGQTTIERTKYYIFSILTFAFALMSKPMAVTWPILLILLDIYPLKRLDIYANSPRQILSGLHSLIFEKWPHFILTFISISVTIYAQSGEMHFFKIGMITRILNAINSIFLYLGKFILPVNLNPLYHVPEYILNQNIFASTILVLCFIVLNIIILIALYKRHIQFAIIWCFMLVALFPVIGLFHVGAAAAADRYTYIPLIPIFLGYGYLLATTFYHYSKFIRLSSAIFTIFVWIFFIHLSQMQTNVWRSNFTFWSYVSSFSPEEITSADAHYLEQYLGDVYYQAGNYEKALEHYIKSDASGDHNNIYSYYKFADSYQRAGIPNFAIDICLFVINKKKPTEEQRKKFLSLLISLYDETDQPELAKKYRLLLE